ncbi:ARM repeat-containing protein [Stereum hirsutum FP-91666 SS1]|uniref:ARM repeat-containing protein n=1 Tax=Stereum hirsutum (strain FP-91666) TaxID=721885 RepID=UPI000440BA8B|nr:ARM repeat-containing protein [Stereum hirsutum FP-91666 SS1]EIM91293.1 ARM repeat-containing protein [Stereum hirsutum FP-91666 SS1]
MNIPQPLPSALATARIIEDLHEISYPEGIKSPKVELNASAAKGKFRYDRDFLPQFMAVCKEKPDNLPPLDALGLEPSDQTSSGFDVTRGGSGRRNSGMVTPSGSVSRNASIGLGFVPSSMGKTSGFGMVQFATTAKTGEEGFALANGPSRSTSLAGSALSGIAMGGGRGPPMSRTNSQGGPDSGKKRERTRSKRIGQTRNESNRVHVSTPAMSNMGPPLEPVAPLEASANRWVAGSTRRGAAAAAVTPDPDSPEMVERKVKGLLNKLTMERFDSISDQIISWANKSETEKDARTLIQVIKLVFEKATDEAAFSEMYARLCRKMTETISPKVQDDGIKNQEGKPIVGGQLFRKYLLNRCQEDFERGWLQRETSAAAALTKATEDEAAARANAASSKEAEEGELYSDEDYAAQKAKQRGLGLIRFMGELFMLQMLTERVMHECIKKLLGNVENPEEEEIESLCTLMNTVGAVLDTEKAHAHMDVYFARMKELTKSPKVNSRIALMLQDVIELREHRWLLFNTPSGSRTIRQIYEAAVKDKAAKDKEFRERQMSIGGSRGGDRGEPQQIGPDRWGTTSGPNRPPPKAGDLSHFYKIAKSTPMRFGPSSVFAGKKEANGREASLSRMASTSNMFSMLSQNPELAVEATTSKPSRPASRKTSVNLTQPGGVPGPTQHRKLQLLPRSKALGEMKAENTPAGSEAGSEDGRAEASAPPSMSEEAATKIIDEDVKEFFSMPMLCAAESYFRSLPEEHHFQLIERLAMAAIESTEADGWLVAAFFAQARENNLCSPASFEEGFVPLAELLDDIAIDAPKAFDLFVVMMKGAGLDEDEERKLRIAEKSMNKAKLIALLV